MDKCATFDSSFETVSEEIISNLPSGAVREALFGQDIEFGDSLLSPTILKEFINKQPNLIKLDLSENLLRDKGISLISILSHLTDLNVAKNGVTNFTLKNIISPMTTLRSLDLSENYFDIDGLRSLISVTANLQNLVCNFVSLGDEGAMFISQNAHQLLTLGLRGTNLSDKGLSLLTSLNHLTEVDISYNTISSTCLSDFIRIMNKKNVEVIADYISLQKQSRKRE